MIYCRVCGKWITALRGEKDMATICNNCRLARQMAIFGPDNRKAAQQQGSLL